MICDELPAVTLPSGLNAGFRLARVSTVVPRRMPSSAVTRSSESTTLPVSRSRRLSRTATISLSKRPSSVARGGALLALGAEGVEVLTGQAPLVGDQLGRDALRHEPADLGVAQADLRAERHAVLAVGEGGTHRDLGHDLDAGGDDDVVGAGDHPLGGEVGRLLGRPALPVDRRRRHRLGEPGGEHGVAAHVDALGADLHDAAHDHVVNESGVEVVALHEGAEHLGGQVGGVPPRQLPVPLASGGPDGVDDHGGAHGDLPGRVGELDRAVKSLPGRPAELQHGRLRRHPERPHPGGRHGTHDRGAHRGGGGQDARDGVRRRRRGVRRRSRSPPSAAPTGSPGTSGRSATTRSTSPGRRRRCANWGSDAATGSS